MDRKDAIIAELMGEVERLRAELHGLREEVARLKRNSSNSSKPPSSDIVKPPKPAPRRGKRKRSIGGQPGHEKHQRKPFDPDEINQAFQYELRASDAVGLVPLEDWYVVQQVELVENPFWITEHRARRYLDPQSGRVITTPLPPEIARSGLVGPRLSAAIAYQKAACHLSYSTIRAFWKELGSLHLCRGQLAKVVQKASAALKGPYAELREALAGQERLGIDESGHKDRGQKHWTWCFRADRFTVFHIDPSRSSDVLKAVLGETFGGVIGCDYFSAYHKYMADTAVVVQFCMAHLIRDVRFLAEHFDQCLARWGQKLLKHLKKLFDTLHRREQLSETGFGRAIQRVREAFLKTARRPPGRAEAQTLASRFRGKEAAHYFTFLTHPGVEPTNNLTEQALRHIVIDRRVTQGTRGEAGMRWCERAWTLLATCAQQARSVFRFLHDALLADFTDRPVPSLLT